LSSSKGSYKGAIAAVATPSGVHLGSFVPAMNPPSSLEYHPALMLSKNERCERVAVTVAGYMLWKAVLKQGGRDNAAPHKQPALGSRQGRDLSQEQGIHVRPHHRSYLQRRSQCVIIIIIADPRQQLGE
jgi:hypothetical protein